MSDYSKLSEKLGKDSNEEQLLNVGSELAAGQLERTLGYWNALTNVLGQNQIELAGVFRSRAVELSDGFKQQIGQIPSPIPLPVGVFKKATEVVHNTLSHEPQQEHSIFANGAQYAGRGKPRDGRAQPAPRQ